ncbi:conserved hypothetical protein [Methanosphaerula palustris E1-9c]|uniref:Uncharacterized protein n=2 Tax=Methanosphaerula palustris TaxID=475088 RepID=B8GFY6_METPE|nr:conserved hypothetical protein [Methanosphaerula palustris E1-9c]
MLVLGVGVIAAAALYFFEPIYGYIMLIFTAVIFMGMKIMEDSLGLPDVTCNLRDDAKAVVMINRGNASITGGHVALVPLNIEFDLPALVPDQRFEYPLTEMVVEAKAVVHYSTVDGRSLSGSFPLSALGEGEEDLLKPTFPLFGWK